MIYINHVKLNSTPLSFSRRISVTSYRSSGSILYYLRFSKMVSCSLNYFTINRTQFNPNCYVSMMTRYLKRGGSTRTTRKYCRIGLTMRYNLIYRLRDLFFPFFFLGFFSQKAKPNSRIRECLTPPRYHNF